MKRKNISPDDHVEVRMSQRDRELLVDHTLADPEYTERLRPVPGKVAFVACYTLNDIEDILGYVAAEANHTEDRKLQGELDAMYERLTSIQDSYDDGLWQDNAV